VRWLAVHSDCEPGHLFVDVQADGPFDAWVHRHEFVDQGGATRMSDAIALEMPGGWLTETLLGPWVLQDLDRLLTYRHQITQRECERAARRSVEETAWG
jgi:ligand-binding SRPBCC domain-containing protein